MRKLDYFLERYEGEFILGCLTALLIFLAALVGYTLWAWSTYG